jgi:hypothetical protein
LTFVVGIGSSLSNLNQIAAGGGTGQAYLVDVLADAGGQAQTAFQQARAGASSCVYDVAPPAGGSIDVGTSHLAYTPGGGTASDLPRLNGAASCSASGDGWYFDANVAPKTVTLCPTTCAKVRSDVSASFALRQGCATP